MRSDAMKTEKNFSKGKKKITEREKKIAANSGRVAAKSNPVAGDHGKGAPLSHPEALLETAMENIDAAGCCSNTSKPITRRE